LNFGLRASLTRFAVVAISFLLSQSFPKTRCY
jgi:hypothetical protein